MENKSGHTAGPWRLDDERDEDRWEIVGKREKATRFGVRGEWTVCQIDADDLPQAEARANARLIAAAPDHALIGWAMCVGAARWEPFKSGKGGEFCMNGIRHSTYLDEFGLPTMTAGMRAAISRAQGSLSPAPESTEKAG